MSQTGKQKTVNTLLFLVLGAGIAALVVGILAWKNDPAKDEVAPVAPEVVYMSTSGVVANIERRLETQTGYGLRARCPKKVDEAVGTKFRCSVRRDGQDAKIAIAHVEINGEGGQFTWKSTPYPEPSATP